MADWFTVEKIDEDTFAISEYGHWEETHCYLLCGRERVLPGHHRLQIPTSLIGDIGRGFGRLERGGKLEQGNGVFDFGTFQIHI